jgi:hypothetical protein
MQSARCKLRQEDCEFEASLSYSETLSQKTKTSKKQNRNEEQIHAVAGMNVETVMLSERSRSKKCHILHHDSCAHELDTKGKFSRIEKR